MLNQQKIVVVLPAYHAARTLERTVGALPMDVVDDVVLVDDASTDETVAVARRLGVRTIVHEVNQGYGANQKTCYQAALDLGADVVVMVHPDYQYEPKLVSAMAGMITSGVYDAVLASRILGGGALAGGMPLWKYVANRALTLVQNALLGAKLSEYHSGYRAFSAPLLRALPLGENSNDFIFDNEMLSQILLGGFRLGEISCPTRYANDASSIGLRRSVVYGLGVLRVSVKGAVKRFSGV
ncbi:MAG: glycosyltransferase family 2 protein [Rhodocyclaceae bacterium]|nr:glycosyltransferase family 2 protein [Rhodocyclaceae bacterium]